MKCEHVSCTRSWWSVEVPSEFEWDEEKRQQVIRRRDVGLLYAALIFDGFVLTAPDHRQDYGEVRLISVGLVDGECFVMVHAERGHVTRRVTAWKGGRRERREYQARLAGAASRDEGGR